MNTPSLLDRGRRGQNLADLDIVDMHGHVGAYSFAIPDRTSESMVAVMDRIGVRQIIVSHMRCMNGEPQIGNRQVHQAMLAHPGRIGGYVSIWPASPQAAADEARQWLDQGFTGIKLHNETGFAYNDPAYALALGIAHERRLPVLLHTWGEAAMFAQVREIAARYRGAFFLLAHSGSSAEADYIRIAAEVPNVYLELCASRTPPGLVERLAAGASVCKLLWGSDCYFINMAHQIGKVLGARLGDADKRRILSENAKAILASAVR